MITGGKRGAAGSGAGGGGAGNAHALSSSGGNVGAGTVSTGSAQTPPKVSPTMRAISQKALMPLCPHIFNAHEFEPALERDQFLCAFNDEGLALDTCVDQFVKFIDHHIGRR